MKRGFVCMCVFEGFEVGKDCVCRSCLVVLCLFVFVWRFGGRTEGEGGDGLISTACLKVCMYIYVRWVAAMCVCERERERELFGCVLFGCEMIGD